MKITIIIDAPHYIGGIRYIERFIKILALTEEKINLNLIYVNCDKSIEANCSKEEKFIKIPSALYRLDRLIARFTNLSLFSLFILKDIKNSNVFFSDVFLPSFIKKTNHIKLIHWFPDFQVYDLKNLFPLNKQISRKLYIKLQLRTCDYLLTQSETDYQRMKLLYPAYANKIVKWSFAEPQFKVEEVDTLTINDVKLKSKSFLLYPHQGWSHKNHLLLIETLQSFKDEILVLTGKLSDPRNPEHSLKLKSAIENSRIPIFSLGLVNGNDLNLLMRNAKAILNFSSYEGWSSCVEEATMLNTPLILSNIKIHLEQIPEASFIDISSGESIKSTLIESLETLKDFKGYNYVKRLENSINQIKFILKKLKA